MLVSVVEAWRQQGDVTEAAELAQIRALLTFRASDRAWARVRPLLDEAGTPETYVVASRILVDQGRYPMAINLLRKALERFPGNEELEHQLARTELPNTLVDRTEPMSDDVDGTVQVAEHLLASGNTLRGRALLERVLQASPDHPRATDLLWALDGDYDLIGLRLHDLTRVYAGRMEPLPTFDESAAEEQTERAPRDEVELLDSPRPSGGFPGLFKNLEPQTELHPFEAGPTDATQTARAGDPAHPAFSLHGADQDTQIVRVVRKPPPEGPDGVDTDIEAQPTNVPPVDLEGESEDENVVLHRPRADEFTHERTETYRPLELDPGRDRLPAGARTADEGADFLKPRPKPVLPEIEEVPPRAPGLMPPAPESTPIQRMPVATAPEPAETQPAPRPELEPADLPPPDTDELDLSDLYQQPSIGFAGWLALGMLIGTGLLALITLVILAASL